MSPWPCSSAFLICRMYRLHGGLGEHWSSPCNRPFCHSTPSLSLLLFLPQPTRAPAPASHLPSALHPLPIYNSIKACSPLPAPAQPSAALLYRQQNRAVIQTHNQAAYSQLKRAVFKEKKTSTMCVRECCLPVFTFS